jgi:hypothetical protein
MCRGPSSFFSNEGQKGEKEDVMQEAHCNDGRRDGRRDGREKEDAAMWIS